MRGAATERRGDGDPELRRLREDLYRPSPPAGAVERYTALLEQRATDDDPAEPDADAPAPRRRRRRAGVVGVLVAALLAGGGTAIGAVAGDRSDAADDGLALPFEPGGSYAVADGDAFASLARGPLPDTRVLARAVRDSDMARLDVWDTTTPGVVLERGDQPFHRRLDGGAADSSSPFGLVVQCAAPGRYRWTLRGTAPGSTTETVLATAGAACGTVPTVGAFTQERGAAIREFDLDLPAGQRWGMALVYALDD